MDGFYDIVLALFGDSSVMMLGLMVFLATAVLAFGLMASVYSRGAVKRRAAGINQNLGDAHDSKTLRRSSLRAVQRVLDYTNKHYATGDQGDAKVLRRRMIQAGIYDQRAVAFFFVARTALAVGAGCAMFFVLPMMMTL